MGTEGKTKGQAGSQRRSLDLFRGEQERSEPESDQSLSDMEWAALMGEQEEPALLSSSLAGGGGESGPKEGVEVVEQNKAREGRGRRTAPGESGLPALPAALAALVIALAAAVYCGITLSSLRERVDGLERLTPALANLAAHEEAIAEMRKEIEAAMRQGKEGRGDTVQAVGEGENSNLAAGLDELQARVDAIEARQRENGSAPPPSRSPQVSPDPARKPEGATKPVPAAGAGKTRTARAAATAAGRGRGPWSVNLGSFRERQAADSLAGRLQSAGYAAVVVEVSVEGGKWQRVRIGGLASEAEARRINQEIARKVGIAGGWVNRN
ncbi:MAG: SPOR domain-containing protein [Thermodesulfobacteriota bacterium]